MFTKIWIYLKAFSIFIKALFKLRDIVISQCEKGHFQLKTWDYCPYCSCIQEAFCVLSHTKINTQAQAILYCYSGIHFGDLLKIGEKEITLGSFAENTFALTTSEKKQNYSFRVQVHPQITMYSESNNPFTVNSSETWKEQLLDYDDLDLLGNRWIILDLKSYLKTDIGHQVETPKPNRKVQIEA